MPGPVGNPLLWGKGGGSYSAADAAAELGGTETDHIPTVLAVVLVVAGGVLFFMDKAGFQIGITASSRAGR